MRSELDQEKALYSLFNNLHSDPILLEVFKEFGIEAFRRSSVLEGFEQFILQTGFRGETVLEIGTLKGMTALILSRYFDHVITIDIIDDPMKYRIADALGIKNIQFVNVKDNAEKSAFVNLHEFDAAYLDGNHSKDTELDFNLTQECGRVMLHENWGPQPAVMKLVNSLGDKVVKSGKLALWTK